VDFYTSMFVSQQGRTQSSTHVCGREAGGEIKQCYCLWRPVKLCFKQEYQEYVPSKFDAAQSSKQLKVAQEKNRQVYPQGDVKMKAAGPTSEISTQIRQTAWRTLHKDVNTKFCRYEDIETYVNLLRAYGTIKEIPTGQNLPGLISGDPD